MQLTLLARAGAHLLLGDRRGRTHIVRQIGGDLADVLKEPIEVRDGFSAVRNALPDPVTLKVKAFNLRELGLRRIEVAFGDGTWFVQRG